MINPIKNLLVLSLIVACVPALEAVEYEVLRSELKERLYSSQTMKTRAEYFQFIEPFLKKAEQTLQLPKLCKHHTDSELVMEYFNCLDNYNRALFGKYCLPKRTYENIIKRATERLVECIEMIKAAWQIKDLNVKTEIHKTAALLHKANEQYYKELSLKYKIWCLVNKAVYRTLLA